jgi:exodeoxyribonuclease-3
VRLVTWNVNSLKMRLPRVLELLEQHAPDVVCLQETKTEPQAFPAGELAAAGYASVHHSAGRWAGVAILAREGLALGDPVRGLPGEMRPEEARWIEADVDGVRVASTYVVNGRAVDAPSFTEKLDFLDAMVARMRALRGRDALFAGDFNIAPADIDVYDPVAFQGATHVTEAERSRLRRMLDEGGLVDAHVALHGPDAQQFTWWDYRQGHFHRGLGLRIDLVLAGGSLASGLERVGIERDYRKGSKPSDHAPLVVDVRRELG